MPIVLQIVEIIHVLAQVLAWPMVAVLAIFWYRDVVLELVSKNNVKLTISGVTIETTIPVLEQSVTESLRGERLTDEHWSWLRRLRDESPLLISDDDKPALRLLRDAGLLRPAEKGFLQNAKAVEITSLGRLVVDAYKRKH